MSASRLHIRWWELLPEAALLGGLTIFLLTERNAALSAFHSGRAVLLMAATAFGWILARLVFARFRRGRVLRTILFAAAAAGVLAVVVFPAYRNERVVEAFPAAGTGQARPVRLRTGPLEGIDHRAAGTASLYRGSDGRLVIGLETFDIQPGPNYDVYVVPGADRHDHDDGIRLDDLRGNQGTQYYAIPAEVPIQTAAWTVLIWCETFGVPVANATPL
jgi:hypothetical protein